jgi:hypothetical protein
MNKRQDFEEKLRWIGEYNRGLKPKPDFSREEMIEVRKYQGELAKERVKEIEKIEW